MSKRQRRDNAGSRMQEILDQLKPQKRPTRAEVAERRRAEAAAKMAERAKRDRELRELQERDDKGAEENDKEIEESENEEGEDNEEDENKYERLSRETDYDKILAKIYYNDLGAGHRGRDVLFFKVKNDQNLPPISRRYIAHWLAKQEAHQISTMGPALAKRKEVQTTIKVSQPGARLLIDLIDASTIANSGYKWILTSIDSYSKVADAEPLHDKEAETVVEGLKKIVKRYGDKGVRILGIQSDNGSEFVAEEMEAYIKSIDAKIWHSLPYRPQSQGMIERWNGTIKRAIGFKRRNGDFQWPRYLPKLVANYNESFHRVLQDTPNHTLEQWFDDEEGTDARVQSNLYKQARYNADFTNRIARQLFAVGDKVRTRINEEKRYGFNWSRQIYEIVSVRKRTYGPGLHEWVYRLKNLSDGAMLPNLYDNFQLLRYVPISENHLVNEGHEIAGVNHVKYLLRPTLQATLDRDGNRQKVPAYVVKMAEDPPRKYSLITRQEAMDLVPKMLENFDRRNSVRWLNVGTANVTFRWTPLEASLRRRN